MKSHLNIDPDYVYLQYQNKGALPPSNIPVTGTAIVSVNGLLGPAITIAGTTSQVTVVSAGSTVTLSLPEDVVLSGASPSLTLTDTTASAKSLTIITDANVANLRESAGASGSLLALDLTNNRVGISTASPGELLSLGLAGTTLGVLSLSGNTSGKVTVQPAAAAGTWTLTLPTSAGTSGYVLRTDGTGITSWAASSGGSVTSVDMSVPAFLSISGNPITTSGTLAVTLSGTALPAANGGTGIASYAVGDLLYASGATALSKLADVAAGQPLLSGGVATAPAYAGYTFSGTATKTYTFPIITDTLAGLGTANVFTANQTISNTAPSLVFTDTTASAKSLTIAVDANIANFRESAGASGSLMVLDLANNRVGFGTATPGYLAEFRKDQNAATELAIRNTTAGASAQSRFFVGSDTYTFYLGQYSSTTSAYGALAANDSYMYASSAFTLMVDSAGGIIKIATGGSAEKFRFTEVGSFKIGTTATRGTTEGTNQLVIANGTAPAGTLTNAACFFVAAGEMKVCDSSGNITLLSPHDKDGQWIHDEVNYKGRRLRVDMERLVKFLDNHFGTDFVHEYTEVIN